MTNFSHISCKDSKFTKAGEITETHTTRKTNKQTRQTDVIAGLVREQLEQEARRTVVSGRCETCFF